MAALDAYHLHGGYPRAGLVVLEQITEQGLDALGVIDDATAYLRRQQEAMMRAEAKARAAGGGA